MNFFKIQINNLKEKCPRSKLFYFTSFIRFNYMIKLIQDLRKQSRRGFFKLTEIEREIREKQLIIKREKRLLKNDEFFDY